MKISENVTKNIWKDFYDSIWNNLSECETDVSLINANNKTILKRQLFCMKWFSEKNYYVDKKIWKKFEACGVNLIALELFMMSWYWSLFCVYKKANIFVLYWNHQQDTNKRRLNKCGVVFRNIKSLLSNKGFLVQTRK